MEVFQETSQCVQRIFSQYTQAWKNTPLLYHYIIWFPSCLFEYANFYSFKTVGWITLECYHCRKTLLIGVHPHYLLETNCSSELCLCKMNTVTHYVSWPCCNFYVQHDQCLLNCLQQSDSISVLIESSI